MKTNHVIFLCIIALMLGACEESSNPEQEPSNPENQEITGKLISKTSCKYTKNGVFNFAETPDTLTCIIYDYNPESKVLNLKHINAGFNCGPDSIYTNITVNNDSIVIEEKESGAFANCTCLYDIEMELDNVEAEQFHFRFIEPYNSEETLSFTIDLSKESSGEYCVSRKNYPWGISSTVNENLIGTLTNYSDCKFMKNSSIENDIPDTLSCIQYAYDSESSTLNLNHINAAFNCCPEEIYIETSISNDTIYISEFETEADCDCNCLYDLDIELQQLNVGNYVISVIEPYNSEEALIFNIDLNSEVSGEYCVLRYRYPWGITSIETPDFSGELSEHSSCKSYNNSGLNEDTDSLSCIEYSYNHTTRTLFLKHINATFNCCPESIDANFSLSNDSIIIDEYQIMGEDYCACVCPFDLEMQIVGIEPQTYQMVFYECYIPEANEIRFEIHLTQETEGIYCVTRYW